MARSGLINSDRVLAALTKVNRAHYVQDIEGAYVDAPQYIGYGATISAPHMHAHAAENLLPLLHPGARVLDVGSGSGYLCAVFHHLISDGAPGKVVGIDHIPELVDWSVENLRKDGLGEAVDDGRIVMVAGDGRQGYPSLGPYDVIHVGAAAPKLPSVLVDQLASPGRMFIPVGSYSQEILQVDKDEHGNVTKKQLFGVMYVPLTDKDKQF
ncbi:Probable protein-L-isoaspartate O-methyltransferase [Sparassis crispa]|uniref:Protein-L-isoaspartate O-methyltransferase n=1 Tax=Sparassis crispa TaxID=139825 RepID=A0A401H2T8_9APHY|nr:Probable protein-L-isoaspartate O-methyltransferase [Sparassis crispa]GBE88709.1 Probable protein-L-isoaspartate O-methyltransferase [Sparassis crispa]